VDLDEPDVAMDFFDGLDNAWYANFKKSILGTTQSGLASTFVTKVDMPDVSQTPGKGRGCGGGIKSDKRTEDKLQDEKPKPKHDMSNVKCFNCGNCAKLPQERRQ
jgi:hypothetical protein